jgi:pimeloyl-ACP methyl ester carboxylesterase
MKIVQWRTSGALLSTTMLLGIVAYAHPQELAQNLRGFKDPNQGLHIAKQGMFFVGGQYYTSSIDGLKYMSGQMYVEYQIPEVVTHPYPIVMIHGAAQTGSNFIATPDGQPGWAQFFVANGYAVYIADQVGRGRSVYSLEQYNSFGPPLDVLSREKNWSLQQEYKLFPRGYMHTQWPGTGREGDPFFDQYYASQVQYNRNGVWTQTVAQAAGAALLDRIGPAIIITHSQSGTFGFLIADKRPDLVKGVVTVEGGGTPRGYTAVGAPNWFEDAPVTGGASWGITNVPITYDPPVTDPGQLTYVREEKAEGPDVRCWVQGSPVRQLPNLKRVPQLLVVGEASSAASTNRCVSRYLTQAGVTNTWVDLGTVGIHGNGHMMMLEKNELEISAFMAGWLQDNVEKGIKAPATR